MVIAHVEGPPPTKVDDALRILLRAVIEEVGYAPRDVYEAIFNPLYINNPVNVFVYDHIKDLARHISEDGINPSKPSHKLIVIKPGRTKDPKRDRWTLDFKSNRIADRVMVVMGKAELERLYKMIFHGMVTQGWSSAKPEPMPVLMGSSGPNQPCFKASSSSRVSDSFISPLRDGMTAKHVDVAKGDLEEVSLQPNMYYIPTVVDNPVFDSFTITHDTITNTFTISVFRITNSTTTTLGGPPKGYEHVRKIKWHVRRLGDRQDSKHEERCDVRIAYCLVCPDGSEGCEWQMPPGWTGTEDDRDSHRGEGFCLFVPLV